MSKKLRADEQNLEMCCAPASKRTGRLLWENDCDGKWEAETFCGAVIGYAVIADDQGPGIITHDLRIWVNDEPAGEIGCLPSIEAAMQIAEAHICALIADAQEESNV